MSSAKKGARGGRLVNMIERDAIITLDGFMCVIVTAEEKLGSATMKIARYEKSTANDNLVEIGWGIDLTANQANTLFEKIDIIREEIEQVKQTAEGSSKKAKI